MKKNILFIHSAGKQGPHTGSNDIVQYLKASLEEECNILCPNMPDPDQPKYEPWKKTISRELAWLEGEVIFIGHSLGGSVLMKYLAEENIENSVKGMFLIASPFWGKKEGWWSEEYNLTKDFQAKLPPESQIFLYHSRDDEWVPFSHLYCYKNDLPHAQVRKFGLRGHSFVDGFPELVSDIKALCALRLNAKIT